MDKIKRALNNNNLISLAGNLGFAAFGFANFFILARTYDKEVFGEWMLYITGMSFVEMIKGGLTTTPFVRFLSLAQSPAERRKIIGSNWIISLSSTLVIGLILYLILALFPSKIYASGFRLFFVWYPVYSLSILFLNNALGVLQADQKFKELVWLRMVNMGLFMSFLGVNWIFYKLRLEYIVIVQFVIVTLVSFYGFVKGWTGFKDITHASSLWMSKLLHFGKYTIGTTIGANLLKSSDNFLIGIMMSKAEVAIYSIPLKLIEVLEIPIRSFVMVALPKMSRESGERESSSVRQSFYQYTGTLTILMVPVVIILFFIAEPMVVLLGGKGYSSSMTIFRIFLIYGLFLPFDRFSGVTLDSINVPRLNFIKVTSMAVVNIVGDVFAIYFFESTQAVAVITILNIVFGCVLGWEYLKSYLNVNFTSMFKTGWFYLKEQSNIILLKIQ